MFRLSDSLQELHQRWLCLRQGRCFLSAKHSRIHSPLYTYTFSSYLHTTAFLRKHHHWWILLHSSDFLLSLQAFLYSNFTEKLCQRFCCIVISSVSALQLFCQICINSLKLKCLISLLKMRNKGSINIMRKNRILPASLNILTYTGSAVPDLLHKILLSFRFFLIFIFFCIFLSLFLSVFCLFLLVCLYTVFKGKVFVQILKQNIVMKLVCKLWVFNTSKFVNGLMSSQYFRMPRGLSYTFLSACHYFFNIFRNLLNKSSFWSALRYVQRKIRTVDHALSEATEFRNHFFDIICNKYWL